MASIGDHTEVPKLVPVQRDEQVIADEILAKAKAAMRAVTALKETEAAQNAQLMATRNYIATKSMVLSEMVDLYCQLWPENNSKKVLADLHEQIAASVQTNRS